MDKTRTKPAFFSLRNWKYSNGGVPRPRYLSILSEVNFATNHIAGHHEQLTDEWRASGELSDGQRHFRSEEVNSQTKTEARVDFVILLLQAGQEASVLVWISFMEWWLEPRHQFCFIILNGKMSKTYFVIGIRNFTRND